ncbi:hypothetical protein ACJ41O_010590 [Fusarium nematophilum]
MDPISRPSPLGHYGTPDTVPQRRLLPSRSTLSLQAAIRQIADQGPAMHTSKTWTSSGDHGVLSDTDELEDRAAFVQEYNRLAKKHGVRMLVVKDLDLRHSGNEPVSPPKRGWLYRILRSSSGQPTSSPKPTSHQAPPRHRRSVSDLAHNLVHHRREAPKTLDLQSMIRLSGKSMFYLPPEHAPSALILPTCLRATAHHIAQNVTTRGIFRIPGSVRIVNVLFDYYCCTEHGSVDITGTVRCANLPMHVQASVHDVASTFKRLLSVIPGGILGSLSLFDALVAIHHQLQGDPEFPRTKHTKVRARLIALAIATVESQFRRELICAVFGLLSLIGRVAEITPREDEEGRPLPTGDLMGYSALGIVFGPLLLGDLLSYYTMQLASPKSGFLRSPKMRQDRFRRKSSEAKSPGPPSVDKVLTANSIAEMLITNWRDVVRQMKSLGMNRRQEQPSLASMRNDSLQQSDSDSFVIKKPQGWDQIWRESKREAEEGHRAGSPEQDAPTLGVPRQRSRNRGSSLLNRLGTKPSFGILSSTVEESIADEENFHGARSQTRHSESSERSGQNRSDHGLLQSQKPNQPAPSGDAVSHPEAEQLPREQTIDAIQLSEHTPRVPIKTPRDTSMLGSPRVSLGDVPPRTSSKKQPGTDRTHRASVDEDAGEAAPTVPLQPGSASIERKNAVRKKNPPRERLRKTPRRSIAVDWAEPTTQSTGASTIDQSGSQPMQLEFSSEQEALEAALKAHAEELKQLDLLVSQEVSPVSRHSRQSLDSAFPKTEHSTSNRRLSDISMEEPHLNGEYTYLGENGAIEHHEATSTQEPLAATSISSTPRQFYAPMRVPSSLTRQSVPTQGVSAPEARVET